MKIFFLLLILVPMVAIYEGYVALKQIMKDCSGLR